MGRGRQEEKNRERVRECSKKTQKVRGRGDGGVEIRREVWELELGGKSMEGGGGVRKKREG